MADALVRIGKIPLATVMIHPTIGVDHPWRYRNKARLHCGEQRSLGYYQEKSKATVRFDDCLLISEGMLILDALEDAALADVSLPVAQRFREWAGPGKERKGSGPAGGAGSGIHWVWGINSTGEPERIAGQGDFTEDVLGAEFKISPLALAAKAKKVWGIEENPYAVDNAQENARRNGIDNVEFIAGRVEDTFGQISDRPDIVVLDPPRAGAQKRVLEGLLELKPDQIIYVSCDPGTLARDLGILQSGDTGWPRCSRWICFPGRCTLSV